MLHWVIVCCMSILGLSLWFSLAVVDQVNLSWQHSLPAKELGKQTISHSVKNIVTIVTLLPTRMQVRYNIFAQHMANEDRIQNIFHIYSLIVCH